MKVPLVTHPEPQLGTNYQRGAGFSNLFLYLMLLLVDGSHNIVSADN